MAYEVTATLRRPQVFDALVGQEFVSKALKSSIQSGKIAHAYLFAGPRGCGKTSTARILAKSLNCDKGPTATPCGECTHCREITAGSSLDVIEIDGASNTSVNDVRQIKDEVMFPPNSSRYKVYIIDEVHMLSTSAFNALLKTIEEPPPHVVFIFATTETQKVPATIKSRCQQFNFRLVAIDDVAALLADAARDAGMEADKEALYWIARQGAGSVRDAYTLFDQVSSFSEGHITYDKIKSHLGLVGVDRLNAIFEHCAAGQASEALEAVNAALADGVSVEQLVSDCAAYMRSILLIKNGITKDALLGEAAERYSTAVCQAWSAVQAERALSLLLQLYRDLRYSLSPKYEVELAISRLSWLKEYVSPSEVKAALDAVRPLLVGSTPAPAYAPAAPAPAASYNTPTAPTPAYASPPVAAPTYSAPPSPSAPAPSAPPASAPSAPAGMPVFSALQGHPQGGGGGGPFENAPAHGSIRPDGLLTNQKGEGIPRAAHPTDNAVGPGFFSPTGQLTAKSNAGEASQGAVSGDLPPQVRILRDIFRGTVTITTRG